MEQRCRGLTHAFDQFRAIIIIAITAALFISSSCQQEHQQLQKTQAPSLIANPEQDARTEDGYGLMAMKDYDPGQVTEMIYGKAGWRERLGFRAVEERRVAWASIIAIEDETIVIDE